MRKQTTIKFLPLLAISCLLSACATMSQQDGDGAVVAHGGEIGSQLFAADSQAVNLDGESLLTGDDGHAILELMDRGDIANLKSVIVYTKVNKTATWTNARRSTTFQVKPTSDNKKQAESTDEPRCRTYQVVMQRDDIETSANGRICLRDEKWQVESVDQSDSDSGPVEEQAPDSADAQNGNAHEDAGNNQHTASRDDDELFGAW